MKKTVYLPLLLASTLFASDPVTIDSLFKSQNGLRSITNLSFVSSGSSNTYAIYPELMTQNDGRIWMDTKSVALNQTFLYGVTKDFDLLASGSGSSNRREYISFSGYQHDDVTGFDSLWLGGIYSFDAIGDFKPQLTAQMSAYQKKRYLEETKGVSANSFILKGSLKNYSDPVVSTFSLGTVINAKNTIGGHETSLSISGFAGGSSDAPDSIFSLSLWQKF